MMYVLPFFIITIIMLTNIFHYLPATHLIYPLPFNSSIIPALVYTSPCVHHSFLPSSNASLYHIVWYIYTYMYASCVCYYWCASWPISYDARGLMTVYRIHMIALIATIPSRCCFDIIWYVKYHHCRHHMWSCHGNPIVHSTHARHTHVICSHDLLHPLMFSLIMSHQRAHVCISRPSSSTVITPAYAYACTHNRNLSPSHPTSIFVVWSWWSDFCHMHHMIAIICLDSSLPLLRHSISSSHRLN